jgi:protein-tyrosine-phosphatase
VLTVAIAGCGSSAGDEATAEVSLAVAKARLAQSLGDICQNHTDRQVVAIARFEKKHGISPEKATGRQLEQELVKVILPIVRDNIHDVGRLRPPVSEQAEFDAFIRALESGVAASEKDPSWIATEATEPFMRAREASANLGTYYCGQA